MTTPKTQLQQIREAAEADLLTFILLVAPQRVLGDMHIDVIRWWTRDDAKPHQLTLLPRAHQKSQLVAYRAAWEITRNPAITIMYISATANLAEKQLHLIKSILDSKVYRRYWPEMINKEEGKRERWSVSEIIVDHPIRVAEVVRDPTVFTAGLTTGVTGLHCDIAILDDVVVQENAYTTEGRKRVRTAYSLLASIENSDALEWVVGTRYHPLDLYQDMIDMEEETYDEDGNVESKSKVYEVYQREVEDVGDGSGEYLWPKQKRADGKWFGFDQKVLATKKAKYLDKTQFHAQYYNNPNDPENEAISHEYFQYYERSHAKQKEGRWYVNGKMVNVYSAIDFAFSTKLRADYTALVTIGIDGDGNIYVLDINRFKTNKIADYYKAIVEAHVAWGFRKIRCEATVAQVAIIEELKVKARQDGLALSFDAHHPSRAQGNKAERVHAVLKPRYENGSMWHYKSGATMDLEEELKAQNPPHDDIKDALAAAVDIAIPPKRHSAPSTTKVVYHPRFGGVSL